MTTTLLSSTLPLDAGWTRASITALTAEWVADVRLYEAGPADYLAMARAHSGIVGAGQKDARSEVTEATPLSFDVLVPERMRTWFNEQWSSVGPDLLWMNHAQWDGLVDHSDHAETLCLIDSHDLVTLNLSMRRALLACLTQPPDPATVAAELVREDFFSHRKFAPDPDEYRLFDRYDYTVAISQEEAVAIASHTSRTRVLHVPMTYAPQYIENRYSGAALFTMGPHPFNLQGYLYFVNRVLPRVRVEVPNFVLSVSGAWYRGMCPVSTPGVTLRGRVADISSLYAAARFCISPVLGGTGESVKIVEAMAHGLPIIALAGSAKGSPIRHGSNGFVATTAEEFAEYAVRLWKDRNLCRRIGRAARETIAAERSETRLDVWLAQLFPGGPRENDKSPGSGAASGTLLPGDP